MKIFSRYNLIARIFPTIIGLIPFSIFQYFFLNNIWNIDSVITSAFGNIGISTILLYTFNQYFVRIPSKIFEDLLFRKQLYFPTTNLLLYSNNEYSLEFKNKIRQAIKRDFSINLPTVVEEANDEKNTRRRIKDAVRIIIGKVKDGHLVLQHNIEYGFVRNLWGASLVGFLGSFILLCLSIPTSPLFLVSEILLVLFSLYLLFGFFVIRYFGYQYAKKLIEEYYKISYDK